ncbi:MAG: hypothetical protein LIO87_04190, partial [Eubacterium sp.]|nr:hypothetical protein [Eubacterium sp.]
ILSAALITVLFPLTVGTAVFGAENSNDDFSKLGITEADITESGGIMSFDYGNDDSGLLKSDDNNSGLLKASDSSYSSYNTDLDNLKYITEPKDQGDMEVCWAFSAASCLETLLMKQDNSANASSSKYNFSELHAVLASSSKFLKDGTYGLAGFDYNGGGNGIMYDMYTTRAADANTFNGPVLETDMAYTASSDEIDKIDSDDMDLEPTDYFPGTFSTLTFTEELTDSQIEARNNIIKDMVDSYGSVSVSIFGGSDSSSSYENFKQTNDYTLFCYTGNTTSTHAVTIVGYDDGFDADIFAGAGFDTPSLNGAFIVKNSWGTGWGKNGGYFYMSYASYIGNIYAYGDLVSRDEYDYEYDYTPYMPTGAFGAYTYEADNTAYGPYYGIYANYFDKQTEAGEEIRYVSVYVSSAETELEIYIDSDSTDGKTNDFSLVSVKSGSGYTLSDGGTSIEVPYVGNYVFELTDPIEVTGGFTVAVYGISDNGYPVAYEDSSTFSNGSYITHNFVNNSYFAFNTYGTFYNMYDTWGYECNFMIRAYTDELSVDLIVDDVAHPAAYGSILSDVLMEHDYAAAQGELFEKAENEETAYYRPVDKNMTLTEDQTYVYTSGYIYAPSIKMEKYQENTADNEIRFVAEITDSFYDEVYEVIELGFYYSKDGGSVNNTNDGDNLYKKLEGDYTAGDGVYLFKSDELPAGNYTVYAFVRYRANGPEDTYTVCTEERTITAD